LVRDLKDRFRANHSNADEYEFLVNDRIDKEKASDPNCKAYLFESSRWDAYFYLRSVPKALDIKLIIAARTNDKHEIIKSFIEDVVRTQLHFKSGDLEMKIQSLFGDLDVYKVYYSGTALSWIGLITGLAVALGSYLCREHKAISILINNAWVYDFVILASIPVSAMFFTRKNYLWKK